MKLVEIIKKAKIIRTKAAEKYNCPEGEFPWGLCMSLASGRDFHETSWEEVRPSPSWEVKPMKKNSLTISIMEKCFHEMVAKKHLSKIISIPEFYRGMKRLAGLDKLSIAKFKQVLSDLFDDMTIDLLSVNEICAIEEPEFVISSPMGELYYVLWR